jgi:hypothetical protein
MGSFVNLLTFIASFASILSVPVAIVQTIRVRRLRVEKQRKVWTQISSIKALMRLMETEKVQTAYGLIGEQFRDCLREAALLEDDFTVRTIKMWRRVGKLSSDWQEYQAAQLLGSSEIEASNGLEEIDAGMSVPLSQFDATSPDHPVATVPANPFRKELPPPTPSEPSPSSLAVPSPNRTVA